MFDLTSPSTLPSAWLSFPGHATFDLRPHAFRFTKVLRALLLTAVILGRGSSYIALRNILDSLSVDVPGNVSFRKEALSTVRLFYWHLSPSLHRHLHHQVFPPLH